MGFKLDASLWLAMPDTKSGIPQQNPAGDFSKKLGLPVPQVDAPELLEPKTPRSKPQDELYMWGSLAGHHLSHMPGLFGATAEPLAVPGAAQVSSSAESAFVLPKADPIQQSITSAPVAATPATLPRGSMPVGDPRRPEQAPLAAFFAQHWPERRLLLLPRDDGTEVVIRDFHLSEEEQHTLASALQHFLQSAGEPLEHIWVNGRLVWQREPSQ